MCMNVCVTYSCTLACIYVPLTDPVLTGSLVLWDVPGDSDCGVECDGGGGEGEGVRRLQEAIHIATGAGDLVEKT